MARDRHGLRSRLVRAFLIQGLLIGAAAVVGVYAAGFALEELLIKSALREEAEHYWRLAGSQPGFPRPDTRNLTGYLAGPATADALPGYLRGLPDGFHDLERDADFSVAYVSSRGQETLYLVFDGERVRELAAVFGLAPLAATLAVLYLAAWIGYRLAGRAISPVVALARRVGEIDPEAPDAEAFAPERLPRSSGAEVDALAESLRRLIERVNAFVERERHFTRDASHELRSPLTVIRLAAEALLANPSLDERARKAAVKVARSAADMQSLTETLLLLARESEHGLDRQHLVLNDLVAEERDRAGGILEGKPVEVRIDERARVTLEAPEKALSVLVGNLLRNAFSYTDEGHIDIVIDAGELRIADSGIGIPADSLGRIFEPYVRAPGTGRRGSGVGLTIVKRVADRFGWVVHIDSTQGVGTVVTVTFPDAHYEPARD